MASVVNCFAVVTTIMLLAGCGSTSNIKSSSGGKFICDKKFTRVIVTKFDDKTPQKKEKNESKVQWACGLFPDLIAQEIEKTNVFDHVSDNVAGSNEFVGAPLVISGEITRFVEGNAFSRYMIGFGAGSSYLNATIRLRDGNTNEEIGVIKVDKNSWALGGGYASGQTPQHFMEGTAKKIAKEITRLGKSD